MVYFGFTCGVPMLFEIEKDKSDEILEWQKAHECEGRDAGTIGGSFEYRFVPTGIGMCIKCVCLCGKEIDVTHPEDW